MNGNFCQWPSKPTLKEDGVITGCARNHEWLLPWWYMNFRTQNEYPITFFDFGDMSDKAKEWCKKRGTLKTLNVPTDQFVVGKEKVPIECKSIWELAVVERQVTGIDIWTARPQFFKKPFAFLQSPYSRTVWIDLDCQVRKPINPIFDYCENQNGIALAEEPPSVRQMHEQSHLIFQGEMEYNTGVVAFKWGSDIIENWAKTCVESNATLRGDQEALSRYAHEKGIRLQAFPETFNWRGNIKIDERIINSILIIHWVGACKGVIQKQMVEFIRMGVDLLI